MENLLITNYIADDLLTSCCTDWAHTRHIFTIIKHTQQGEKDICILGLVFTGQKPQRLKWLSNKTVANWIWDRPAADNKALQLCLFIWMPHTLPDLSCTHAHTHTFLYLDTYSFQRTYGHTHKYTHIYTLTGSEQGKYYELCVSSLEGILNLSKSHIPCLYKLKVTGKLPGEAALDASFHFDFFSMEISNMPQSPWTLTYPSSRHRTH